MLASFEVHKNLRKIMFLFYQAINIPIDCYFLFVAQGFVSVALNIETDNFGDASFFI